METFLVQLASLQPSQFCLSMRKLQAALATFDVSSLRPFPVREVGGVYALTDNHHTAFIAWLCGLREATVWYDTDDIDTEAYERSVRECRARGIARLPDLAGRLVPHADYERTWCAWCDQMHAELQEERSRDPHAAARATVYLRHITPADAGFLHSLCSDDRVRTRLALGAHGPAYWAEAIAAWAADPDEEVFIACTRSPDRPIGWVAINGIGNSDRTCWIKMMALVPEIWNRGFGRTCVDMLKRRAAARRCTRIRLWVDAGNAAAIRCYEHCGFRRVREEPGTMGDSPDQRQRVLMESLLDDLRDRDAGKMQHEEG